MRRTPGAAGRAEAAAAAAEAAAAAVPLAKLLLLHLRLVLLQGDLRLRHLHLHGAGAEAFSRVHQHRCQVLRAAEASARMPRCRAANGPSDQIQCKGCHHQLP